MIEKAIKLISDSNMDYLLDRISTEEYSQRLQIALSSINYTFGKKSFEIIIVDNDLDSKFFGIRIFPAVDKMDRFTEKFIRGSVAGTNDFPTICREWKEIDKWVVEIDSLIFDRRAISFTNEEITALILHEVGNVIFSDEPLELFYLAHRISTKLLNNAQRVSQNLMYSLFMIPLANACIQPNWVDGNNKLRYEVIADSTVALLGYGEHLHSAIVKIVSSYGSVDNSIETQRDEVRTSADWCAMNIMDVIKRRETMKDELYYQAVTTRSTYLKALRIAIIDKMGFKMRERYTGAVIENTIGLLQDKSSFIDHIAYDPPEEFMKFESKYMAYINNVDHMSAMESRTRKKVLLPSQYEIDSLVIEYDKITNHHDRIFVLDLIYEVAEKIEMFENAVENNPVEKKKWANKINKMKNELAGIRQDVLKKKIVKTTSKLFVEVPDEYAG